MDAHAMSTTTDDGITALPSTVVIGWHCVDAPADAVSLLTLARADGYDFITVPATTATTSQRRTDMTLLESKWWRTSVVGTIPSCDDMSSSSSSNRANSYESIFTAALEWSLHMNLPALLIPPLPTQLSEVVLYANALLSSIAQTSLRDLQIWIPVTLTAATDPSSMLQYLYRCLDYHPSIHTVLTLEPVPKPLPSSLYLIDLLRCVHLCIGSGIPPLVALGLPKDVFLTNKRGFPTLSRLHQTVVALLLRRVGRSIKVLIATPQPSPTAVSPLTPEQHGRTGVLPHYQYLQHLRTSKEEITTVLDHDPKTSMERSYLDALQSPLQPLADHLEFHTYEIFEQDPVKYVQYRTAMHRAMRDYCATQSSNTATTIPYIVLVVGAGRGPLVTACIQAYQQLQAESTQPQLQLNLFAVEKNPSALLYLQSKFDTVALQAQSPGNLYVRVVASDLRYIKAGDLFASSSLSPSTVPKANLVVSELLGSFGCNELSPECLDALLYETDVCGPETISIPHRYVSHITPIASMKLYQQVKQQALYPLALDGTTQQVVGWCKAVETPYVVRPHAASQIHPTQECWSFVHDPASRVDNSVSHQPQERHVHLEFSSPEGTTALKDAQGALYGNGYGGTDDLVESSLHAFRDTMNQDHDDDASTLEHLPWTCTGLLGTFTADLYHSRSEAAIQISTQPDHFSRGMFSWFPLYFPAQHPMVVPAGGRISVDVWRKCTRHKVWYEWAFTVQTASTIDPNRIVYVSPVHNPGGRSSFVSVQ
jgi:type II protein arginine methyltransferase